jgi:hypothetical protein
MTFQDSYFEHVQQNAFRENHWFNEYVHFSPLFSILIHLQSIHPCVPEEEDDGRGGGGGMVAAAVYPNILTIRIFLNT